MKKILYSLSVVLVILCATIFAALPMTASAAVADDAEIASTAFNTRQGETFTTTIYIANNANIVDFDIHLTYNTEYVTLISADENEDIKGTVIFNTENVGTIDINYTRTSVNVTKQTFLVDLTFKVNENLAPGVYDCISVDKTGTYIAHTLVGNVLQSVDFECDFEPLVIYEMGDVDLSCDVNIGDATYIRRHLAKLFTLSDYQLLFADTYYDGAIDIADAVGLQRYLAKYNVTYGNRVNVTFCDMNGNEIVKKSVVVNTALNTVPSVPAVVGYSNGRWSLSPSSDITPNFTNVTEAISVYARYDKSVSESMQWYIDALDTLVSGYNGTITSNWNLPTAYTYANDNNKTSAIAWEVSNANVFSTTGVFTEPTYDTPITLTAKIYSYDDGVLESSTIKSYSLLAKGAYSTPTKAEIVDYLQSITNGTISADGTTSITGGTIDCDLNLVKKITNEQVGSATPYEVRIEWLIDNNGAYETISQIKRSTSVQKANLVAIVTFNGTPLEGDGKVYFDDVTLSAITEEEIRSYIINQVADNVAVSFSTGDHLWDNDAQYGCTLKWVSNETKLMTIEQNTVTVNPDAVNGVSCPIELQVSYSTDEGTKTFELEYSVTINTSNELLQAGTNIDPALYYVLLNEMRDRFGITTLTTTALKNEKFVYLDLSQYKDGVTDPVTGNPLQITDLSGLAYCKNLYVLNISGLNIKNGLSEISTLTKLEALIANNCNISSLSSGGTPVLAGMHNLKLLDLSSNAFTSLDTVLDADTVYGRLKEIYLNDNELNSISQLANAPFVQLLTLSNNNLDSTDISALSSMSYLTYLSLADNSITDISSLGGLKNLTELRLQKNKISDVTALKDMTEMVSLYLGDNQITNVSKLEKLTKITTLYLNNNAELENVDVVSGMTGLKVLNVSGDNIDNLNAVSALVELIELFAENNSISSFAFVQNLTNLNKLLLANNRGTGDEADNMSEYLGGLSNLTVLTLSGKKLNSLDFLQTTNANNNTTMKPIVRLEVANCSLPSYYVTGIADTTVTEHVDNINLLAALKQTLLYLDISGNGLAYNIDGLTFNNSVPVTIDKLKDLSNLQLLYADNTDIGNKITNLMSMMSRIKYLSLEHCNISDISWLTKSAYYVYADVANNPILSFDFSHVARSLGTLRYLYLDSTATNAVYVCDDPSDYDENILVALSLRNTGISDMSKLPALPEVQYLDVAQECVDIFTKSNLDLLYEKYRNIAVYLYADGQIPSGFVDDGILNAQKEARRIMDMREENTADGDKFQSYYSNVVEFRNKQNGYELDSTLNGYNATWSMDANNAYFSIEDNKLYVHNIALPIGADEDYIFELNISMTLYEQAVSVTTLAMFHKGKYDIKYNLLTQKTDTAQNVVVDNKGNTTQYTPGDEIIINNPTRGEYDIFQGWYEDVDFTIPFYNDLAENPRSVTLYAKWDLAVYFNTLESTPQLYYNASRVVVDWSQYTSTHDYYAAIDADGDGGRDASNNTVNLNIDIGAGVKEVYFIGNQSAYFYNVRIVPVQFADGANLTLHFKDFKFNGCIEGYRCGDFNLIIDVMKGNEVSQITSGPNPNAIYSLSNVTIVGDGEFQVLGHYATDAYVASGHGSDGGAAIHVNKLIVDMTGKLAVYGGDGGDGANGNNQSIGTASTNAPATATTNGGNGGNGGQAVIASMVAIRNSGIVQFYGGRGGNGGNGGSVTGAGSYSGHADLPDGADGGNGGNGGNPLGSDTTIILTPTSQLLLQYGNGGNGGNGGDGGDAGWPDKGIKPDGKGHGGDAGYGGYGYNGGNAGVGGIGGYSFYNHSTVGKGQYGTTGDGGQGNYGGNAMASVVYQNGVAELQYGAVGAGGAGGRAGEWEPAAYSTKPNIGVDRSGIVGAAGVQIACSYNVSVKQNLLNISGVYNNLNNGTVVHRYIDMDAASGVAGEVMLMIINNGEAHPYCGGFYTEQCSAPNQVFYHTFVAKIPVGYSVNCFQNLIGDGAAVEWLTSNEGTGEWATYTYKVTCGSTGTFSTFGFVALAGEYGVTWYVADSYVFVDA